MRRFKSFFHKQEYLRWLAYQTKKARKTNELDYVCAVDQLLADGDYDACNNCPYLALDTQMCLHRIWFGAVA